MSLSARLQQWIVPINVRSCLCVWLVSRELILWLQLIYFIYRFIWNSASVSWWTIIGYAFLTAMTYMSYSWVVGAAEEGGTSEYAMDVLLVTLFVQAGLIFSDYFWLVYLVVSTLSGACLLVQHGSLMRSANGNVDPWLSALPRRQDAAQLRVHAGRRHAR